MIEKLPLGILVAVSIKDVLCLGWIDNNVMITLSTVHIVNQVNDLII